MFICVKFFSTSTAQVRQKHLHCTEKAYNAGKSPVLKVFKGGLRLLPAACVALRAGPTLPRKRKILIISLQSQPTLVCCANKAEAQAAVPERRSAAVPVAKSPLKNLILFFSKDKNQIEKVPLSDFFPDYNLL